MTEPIPTEPDAPLTPSAAPLPDEKPIVVAVDEVSDGQAEALDEKERQDAYNGVYHWQGKELLPFTPSKKALWERLCLHDVPLPPLVELGSLDLYVPRAVKLLYLLTHKPEAYRLMRADPGQFLEAVDQWQDETMAQTDAADLVSLALTITNAASRNIAVPKPMGSSRAGE